MKRIQEGDATCEANQVLHDQAVDLLRKIDENRYYVPAVADPLAPRTFVHRIQSPVFLACQFTDEQTGGHCPTLASRFTGTSRKWFTFTNGTHIDSLDPATFNRWFDFLELYVAQRAPNLSPALQRARARAIFSAAMGVNGVTLPPDPIQGQRDLRRGAQGVRGAAARAGALRQRRGRARRPARPWPASSARSRASRVPGTTARSWYLGRGGTLSAGRARPKGADAFTWDPAARPPTSFTGNTGSGPGGLWTATPAYNWAQQPGRARAVLPDRTAGRARRRSSARAPCRRGSSPPRPT